MFSFSWHVIVIFWVVILCRQGIPEEGGPLFHPHLRPNRVTAHNPHVLLPEAEIICAYMYHKEKGSLLTLYCYQCDWQQMGYQALPPQWGPLQNEKFLVVSCVSKYDCYLLYTLIHDRSVLMGLCSLCKKKKKLQVEIPV